MAVGVVLLAGVQLDVEPVGVGFASAVLWAAYILVGKRVADTGDGQDSLAVGMAAAAVLLAPFVVIPQLAIDAAVFADPRTCLLERLEVADDLRGQRNWWLLATVNNWPEQPDLAPIFTRFAQALRARTA
ncbi:hypothetical protein ACTWPB_24940 [Nocardia sp. IBHARD005]|uniref:hypothetical protein n=1 Tax=Nocardia sp. IBHARD005 TaxID=3457765 RepID=UPI004058F5DD